MILDLNIDEIKQLEYELRYREGELMGGGDTEQANRLAGITDKIFNAKNKVYVVVEDWANDGDDGASVLGVYSTEELAIKKLDECVESFRKNVGDYDTTHYRKGGGNYESYDDGFWSEQHEWLFIEPVILDEDLK